MQLMTNISIKILWGVSPQVTQVDANIHHDPKFSLKFWLTLEKFSVLSLINCFNEKKCNFIEDFIGIYFGRSFVTLKLCYNIFYRSCVLWNNFQESRLNQRISQSINLKQISVFWWVVKLVLCIDSDVGNSGNVNIFGRETPLQIQ